MDSNYEKPYKVNAVPSVRELFFGFTRSGYKFRDALAEYIDNSFQQALKASDPSKVRIEVSYGSNGPIYYLEITDNAGGAKIEDAVNFIRPGASGNDSTSESFGLFGIGGKIAGLSVVKEAVIVKSRAIGEKGFQITLDKKEIETKSDWMFDVIPLQTDSNVEEGTTTVILHGIPSEEALNLKNTTLADYRKRYAYLLTSNDGKVPKIFLDGKEVVPRDPREDMLSSEEAPKNCEPTHYIDSKEIRSVQQDNDLHLDKLEFEAIVGVRPESSTIGESGAAIYCNNRLIETNSQIAINPSFNNEEESRIHPASDKAWVNAVVNVKGPANLMPWTSRKDGLDPSVESYHLLEKFLADAYNDFLSNHIGKAREELRSNLDYGHKKVSVSDILIDSYVRKLKGGDLHTETVRPRVKTSHSFIRAIGKTKSVGKTEPPEETNVITLQARVERDKVEKVKRLIATETGSVIIKNTELIRYLIEYILKYSSEAIGNEGELE